MIQNGDSLPTSALALSLLIDQDLYLDGFVPRTFRPDSGYPASAHRFRVLLRRGHWISVYPVVIPILVAPVYAPLAGYLKLARVRPESVEGRQLMDLFEKLAVSLIASISTVFLYFCLLDLGKHRGLAFLLRLAYALGSDKCWVP